MKRSILLFTASAFVIYLSMSSYAAGPSASAGHVAVSGCGTSTTCHGAKSTATTAAITIKNGSTVVTDNKYTPGVKYQITITGTNSTKTKFGYQFSATKSGGAQAGTMSAVPVGSKSASASGLTVVEHSAPVTGAPGLSVSFDWTAPAAGTGNVTLSASVNGVNGDNTTSGDAYNNIQVTLTESAASSVAMVTEVKVGIYPNPANDVLHVVVGNVTSAYDVLVYDMSGKVLVKQSAEGREVTLNTSTFNKGLYFVQVLYKGGKQTVPFVKE